MTLLVHPSKLSTLNNYICLLLTLSCYGNKGYPIAHVLPDFSASLQLGKSISLIMSINEYKWLVSLSGKDSFQSPVQSFSCSFSPAGSTNQPSVQGAEQRIEGQESLSHWERPLSCRVSHTPHELTTVSHKSLLLWITEISRLYITTEKPFLSWLLYLCTKHTYRHRRSGEYKVLLFSFFQNWDGSTDTNYNLLSQTTLSFGDLFQRNFIIFSINKACNKQLMLRTNIYFNAGWIFITIL